MTTDEKIAEERRAERIMLAALSSERLMSQVRRSMELERQASRV